RYLVHNLEHGYVVFYYGADAPTGQVQELKSFASQQLEAGFPKVVVAPWPDDLPGGAHFATVSWKTRQLCREFSPEVALTYLNEHHGGKSGAPEAFVQAHTGADNPVRPEAEGPFLLPPEGAAPTQAPGAAPTQPPGAATGPAATEAGSS
ncbi:MAG: DUF3105 domain-containing protein, partial [Actinomycetota bacterium]|nr:DUF3105 domain-containing protein [Actinomycetota bacterium]